MGRVFIGTKAETLERLAPVVTGARVLPQVRFTHSEWASAPERVIARVASTNWGAGKLIVRSSMAAEDAAGRSLAGHFVSVPNVLGDEHLRNAADMVFASYGEPSPADQVFVQPMLDAVRCAGVAFSREPNTGAPYFVINYDDTSGWTHTVTSGGNNATKTLYCHRAAPFAIPGDLQRVTALLRELEGFLRTEALDIEFSFDQEGCLFLLQVRPLGCAPKPLLDSEAHSKLVSQLHRNLTARMRPHPYLHGKRTVFGIMPDWNPAEIIGVRPRPLALSLYKDLVTDNIWAYQRDNYGYRNLRSFPLLVDFFGLPYIDVRVSFNSFIPADVSGDLAERLANYYIDQLVLSPSHHDKVEFEIIFSCYTLDLPQRLKRLADHGFSARDCSELSDTLRKLTNTIIHGEKGLWRGDIDRIHQLDQRRETILASGLDHVGKIYWLLEDCKRYGTLPFAGLARAGFIAVQLLQSLRNVGVLTEFEYGNFMGELDTVSSRMARDLGELDRAAFLARYGHLRPGTYDILSPRYDEEPDRYFDWSAPGAPVERRSEPFVLGLEQLRRIETLLDEHNLDHDVLGLFAFIKAAIEGREYAKFIFSHSLSDALRLLRDLGAEFGFSIDDCSYADINCIRELYASSKSPGEALSRDMERGRKQYELAEQIFLSPLITSPDDAWAFHVPATQPNFVTLKRAVGRVIRAGEQDLAKLKGSIMLIPSADPGFDWIFSHGIAGFVTMYGGANSHMAIRAGELGIPAVIGVGDAQFNQCTRAAVLEIDAAAKQLKVLR